MKWRRTAAVLTASVVLVTVAPAAHATGGRAARRLLVVDDGRTNVTAISAELDRAGLAYDVIDTRADHRRRVTWRLLTRGTGPHRRARYQGVVLPHEAALPARELATLARYQRRFGVRRVDAYTWPSPAVGLGIQQWNGTPDGMATTLTVAARAAGFDRLTTPIRLDDVRPDVEESYAALSEPAGPAFTPFVTAEIPGRPGRAGVLIGAYAHDGHEDLVITFAMQPGQGHTRAFGPSIIRWLTGPTHTGY